MEPLAHSADPKKKIGPQTYVDHISSVVNGAINRAKITAGFSCRYGSALRNAVQHGAIWHDLGKLEPANQVGLRSTKREKLPINHCDAGVAHLLSDKPWNPIKFLAAHLVFAHHIGLPWPTEEGVKGESLYLRDGKVRPSGEPLWKVTDQHLAMLVKEHLRLLPDLSADNLSYCESLLPIVFRIALSCLVDSDHADTAHHYGDAPFFDDPPLLAAERLSYLDAYVNDLGRDKTDDRNRLRKKVYDACRSADTASALWECDSPVGTGKTTAVMAHLLKAAVAKKLRRIFVVLPFTNIINQSVDVYRRSLLLSGENPDNIIVAHHHKAEFARKDSRQFAALWRCAYRRHYSGAILSNPCQQSSRFTSKTPSSSRISHLH